MRIILVLAMFLSTFNALASDQITPQAPTREANRAAVLAADKDNATRYAGNQDMLVLPGIWADRTGKWVRVQAEATGLKQGDPAEFLMISEDSGHAYETLLVSFAKPSDIHKALVFIGMEPGKPFSQSDLRFWPKGERVLVSIEWQDPSRSAKKGKTRGMTTLRRERSEDMMINSKTGKPFSKDGFVFSGSMIKPDPSGTGMVYAADAFEPNAIIAHYNDPETVLDVPRRALQHDVYADQIPNPACMMPTGALVQVVLEPEYKDGKKRVVDMDMTVRPDGKGSSNFVFNLSEGASLMLDGAGLEKVLASFERILAGGRDPFVQVKIDDSLSLTAIEGFCRFLSQIDQAGGVRIEPPAKGQLYYKAFMPPEKFRKREDRHAQPWELHLSEKDGRVHARLLLLEEVKNDAGEWVVRETEMNATDPEAVKKSIAMTRTGGVPLGLSVLYVFAPPHMAYRNLMPWTAPAVEAQFTVFVFPE